jgi:hypothetical protein
MTINPSVLSSYRAHNTSFKSLPRQKNLFGPEQDGGTWATNEVVFNMKLWTFLHYPQHRTLFICVFCTKYIKLTQNREVICVIRQHISSPRLLNNLIETWTGGLQCENEDLSCNCPTRLAVLADTHTRSNSGQHTIIIYHLHEFSEL